MRRLLERRPGKSHAANLAVCEAAGELILCTDDDVVVDENWLREYVRAARDWPEAAYFGGTVDPWFESPPPTRLEANVGMLHEPFALAQHGPQVFPLVDQAVVGANMAIKTEVARRFPFDVTLGPIGERAQRGEETELVGRLRAAGLAGVWVGPARVQHLITADRLTQAYLWHWYGGLGSHMAQRAAITPDVPSCLAHHGGPSDVRPASPEILACVSFKRRCGSDPSPSCVDAGILWKLAERGRRPLAEGVPEHAHHRCAGK